MTQELTRYRKLADAVSTDLGEEVAVLNMRNGAYLGLNATAAFVWRELDTADTVPALCDRLVSTFAVEGSAAQAAVDGLLARLEREGVVERVAVGAQ